MLPSVFMLDLLVESPTRPFDGLSAPRRGRPERLRIGPLPHRGVADPALVDLPPPEPPAPRGRGWLPRLRLARQAASA